jgi:glyoxylase I family protein
MQTRRYNRVKNGATMKTQRRELLTALTAVAGSTLLPSSLAVAEQTPGANPSGKEAVIGIGGFFYRAHDPKALEQWYQDNLGIPMTPKSLTDPVWTQQAGQTFVLAFSETSKYFDPAKPWMINFRVRDLDKMAAQLEAAGTTVKVDPTTYPNGRFAHLHDPEGNPIELWQPK